MGSSILLLPFFINFIITDSVNVSIPIISQLDYFGTTNNGGHTESTSLTTSMDILDKRPRIEMTDNANDSPEIMSKSDTIVSSSVGSTIVKNLLPSNISEQSKTSTSIVYTSIKTATQSADLKTAPLQITFSTNSFSTQEESSTSKSETPSTHEEHSYNSSIPTQASDSEMFIYSSVALSSIAKREENTDQTTELTGFLTDHSTSSESFITTDEHFITASSMEEDEENTKSFAKLDEKSSSMNYFTSSTVFSSNINDDEKKKSTTSSIAETESDVLTNEQGSIESTHGLSDITEKSITAPAETESILKDHSEKINPIIMSTSKTINIISSSSGASEAVQTGNSGQRSESQETTTEFKTPMSSTPENEESLFVGDTSLFIKEETLDALSVASSQQSIPHLKVPSTTQAPNLSATVRIEIIPEVTTSAEKKNLSIIEEEEEDKEIEESNEDIKSDEEGNIETSTQNESTSIALKDTDKSSETEIGVLVNTEIKTRPKIEVQATAETQTKPTIEVQSTTETQTKLLTEIQTTTNLPETTRLFVINKIKGLEASEDKGLEGRIIVAPHAGNTAIIRIQTEKPTSATTELIPFKTPFSFRITSIDYIREFEDLQSGKFKKLRDQLLPELEEIFGAIVTRNFYGVNIENFEKGSVIVNGLLLTQEKPTETEAILIQLEQRISVKNNKLGGNEIDPRSISFDSLLPRNNIERIQEGYTSGSKSSFLMGSAIAVFVLAILIIIFVMAMINNKRTNGSLKLKQENISMAECGHVPWESAQSPVNLMGYGNNRSRQSSKIHSSGIKVGPS